jgi:hypothetical protein
MGMILPAAHTDSGSSCGNGDSHSVSLSTSYYGANSNGGRPPRDTVAYDSDIDKDSD